MSQPAVRQARMLLVRLGWCVSRILGAGVGWQGGMHRWQADIAGWGWLAVCLAGGWEPILVPRFRTSANLIFPNPSILVLQPCKRRRKTPSRNPKWRGDSTFHFLSSFGTCFDSVTGGHGSDSPAHVSVCS